MRSTRFLDPPENDWRSDSTASRRTALRPLSTTTQRSRSLPMSLVATVPRSSDCASVGWPYRLRNWTRDSTPNTSVDRAAKVEGCSENTRIS